MAPNDQTQRCGIACPYYLWLAGWLAPITSSPSKAPCQAATRRCGAQGSLGGTFSAGTNIRDLSKNPALQVRRGRFSTLPGQLCRCQKDVALPLHELLFIPVEMTQEYPRDGCWILGGEKEGGKLL